MISLISDYYLLLNLKTPIFSESTLYVVPWCESFEAGAMPGLKLNSEITRKHICLDPVDDADGTKDENHLNKSLLSPLKKAKVETEEVRK